MANQEVKWMIYLAILTCWPRFDALHLNTVQLHVASDTFGYRLHEADHCTWNKTLAGRPYEDQQPAGHMKSNLVGWGHLLLDQDLVQHRALGLEALGHTVKLHQGHNLQENFR